MGRVMNRVMVALARAGVSLRGMHELRVRGRVSGRRRSVPVNVLHLDGARYLVAPRGQTHWVRNLRAAGAGELRVGRRTEAFTAQELPDDAKPVVLKAYLTRWSLEVKSLFEGVNPSSTDEEFRRVADRYPVFRIR
ncbi:MAG: nitroreductase family deazaflavin-dependent oxidoreductase [Actinomycetales bacterium]|nr:nitroreductase family deazaflavin-dependent oxidoreductase [Actinomycetales bacterium]